MPRACSAALTSRRWRQAEHQRPVPVADQLLHQIEEGVEALQGAFLELVDLDEPGKGDPQPPARLREISLIRSRRLRHLGQGLYIDARDQRQLVLHLFEPSGKVSAMLARQTEIHRPFGKRDTCRRKRLRRHRRMRSGKPVNGQHRALKKSRKGICRAMRRAYRLMRLSIRDEHRSDHLRRSPAAAGVAV